MPHNDVVYKLREAMLTASDGENSPALEAVILEEMKARLEDVKLRVGIVKGFLSVVTVVTRFVWWRCTRGPAASSRLTTSAQSWRTGTCGPALGSGTPVWWRWPKIIR